MLKRSGKQIKVFEICIKAAIFIKTDFDSNIVFFLTVFSFYGCAYISEIGSRALSGNLHIADKSKSGTDLI